MLQCETNTHTMERKVRSAFRAKYHVRTFDTHFEHGQWWVIRMDGTAYAVVDTSMGLDFEEIG